MLLGRVRLAEVLHDGRVEDVPPRGQQVALAVDLCARSVAVAASAAERENGKEEEEEKAEPIRRWRARREIGR